jgi:DNA repair protein RecN (Recombination protein N)
VFDEIDTGISGKTAWKVSEKLAVLRKRHQVICITHLPQIAAMADAHYGIEKSVFEDKTHTQVRKLNQEESIKEIGRLLGTDQLTDAVLQNAREMKDLAEQTKQSQSKNK